MRELPEPDVRDGMWSIKDEIWCMTPMHYSPKLVLAIQKQAYEDGLRDANLREAYENACKLVADMHHAAIGTIAGPELGVVEDVKELRNDADRYRWMRNIANAYELRPICNMPPSEWDKAIDAAIRAAIKEQT